MSVVLLGVLVQILGPALIGLALLLVAALLSGFLSRNGRSQILERNPLLARRLQSIARLMAGWIVPGSSRAPPTRPPAGSLQPVPVPSRRRRRRRSERPSDL